MTAAFVWMLEISGSVPPAHFARGYAEAVSERQPPMYFRLGGGTIKGISKPGAVVWSRIYVEAGKSQGRYGHGQIRGFAAGGDRAALADHHAAMADDAHGASRHQPRPVHGAALLQPYPGGVCAGCGTGAAKALSVKAAMFSEMGIAVNFCGDVAA